MTVGGLAHLTAHAERLQRIQPQPAAIPGVPESVHELSVEVPLDGGQTHQDDVFLFGW